MTKESIELEEWSGVTNNTGLCGHGREYCDKNKLSVNRGVRHLFKE